MDGLNAGPTCAPGARGLFPLPCGSELQEQIPVMSMDGRNARKCQSNFRRLPWMDGNCRIRLRSRHQRTLPHPCESVRCCSRQWQTNGGAPLPANFTHPSGGSLALWRRRTLRRPRRIAAGNRGDEGINASTSRRDKNAAMRRTSACERYPRGAASAARNGSSNAP